MRSRKCNEIPQMPKGMASDLRQTLQRGAGVSSVRATTLQHDLPLLDDVEID
jgi:hypothetical protein